MATLVLQAVGAVAGEFIGGPIGAVIGRVVGATAGAFIDQRLFGGNGGNRVGPRLTTLAGVTSTEGAAIPRVFGRARVGGQMIWATRFEETVTVARAGGGGGKGGGGGSKTTTYNYFANFAIGLCEGPIAGVRRVWADGKELDLTQFVMRVHPGGEDAEPDPLIVAKEGEENAPAYRGLAYVVFERMALADFGNRVPQLAFEIVRPVDGVGKMIRAVDLIPGATEYAYATSALTDVLAPGVSRGENRHQLYAPSDMTASLDALQALCPNLESVALVVAWYGDDLRAGQCSIAPRVERRDKIVAGQIWQVAGYDRNSAAEVSRVNGAPAFGGTPPDDVVVSAIQELKSRGLKVVFYPFVMMDIPAGNGRLDPWTGGAGQAPYPWRGRVTCEPAPGLPGSPDGTPAAAAQIDDFFSGGDANYRSFVLHYANLCAAAGGVDAFLVGSEFASLTRVRSASGVYPAAGALAALAGDAKSILGASTKVSYAADWTEYGAHVLGGGAEVRFPLDVVWGSPAVDFVGIDAYFPLSDWRDGTDHLDASIARSVYDVDYLRARVASGEAFDWHYPDGAAREAQLRAPIADGAHGKPWVFRQKDLAGWWSNPHFERIGGVELSAPTAWPPAGKPIWLTETGCPAVDRGANQPNVFPDPKSSESAAPYFSRGFRDDLIQARALEAVLSHFDPALPGHVEGANPVSPVYGGRMVDPARVHVWAWDARPFPAFPMQSGVWADAANWETGHWINGRVEGAPLDWLVKAIVEASRPGAAPVARPAIDGFVDGYALDRIVSARAALEPLAAMFGFDGIIAGGDIRFAGRASRAAVALGPDDLVPASDGKLVTLTRAQESETPREIALTVTDGLADYRPATILSRRLEGGSSRQSEAEVAVVIGRAEAQRLADVWLQDLWTARESAEFSVRPGLASLEIGDAISLEIAGAPRLFLIERLTDGLAREVVARAIEPSVYDSAPPVFTRPPSPAPRLPGPGLVRTLDLAIARGDPAALQYVAVFADPWPGAMALWRASGAATFDFMKIIERNAIAGATLDITPPGPIDRIDRASVFRVSVPGALASIDEARMFAGRNAAALRGPDGAWEIIAFSGAELVADGVYRLSGLLRGLGGQSGLATRTLAAGAPFVLLDEAVTPLTSSLADLGAPVRWRVGPANRDYSDPACVEFTATATDLALKPWAPVAPAARRASDGVEITFIRRGRVDSDAWAPLDIPLGEEREAYEIDILRGGAVARTISTSAQAALYANADEHSDFGAVQTALDLRIYQIGATVGRGFPLVATTPVR